MPTPTAPLFSPARLTYLDGGMGTLLQSMGLCGGERPERWNLLHPERVLSVHAAYLAAGCDVVTSNTFGAARAHLGNEAERCMRAGVRLAKQAVREAGHGFAAADMGSLGRLLAPYGDLPFEEAVCQFRDAFSAAIDEGADLLLIETMTDLMEVKACALGAKEAMAGAGVALPLLCSLTFDLRGRLLSGADIPGTVAMLAGLRVDAIGLNCGHEPAALMDNVRALLSASPLPVFVSPNASVPEVRNGQTVFATTPEAFARDMRKIAELGAAGLGGCCGTTPQHIHAMVEATADFVPGARAAFAGCVVSGRSASLSLDARPALIGERLNPTGKRRMKEALRQGDMDYLLRQAVEQADAGADALDVNVGLPEVDEPAMLRRAVEAVQTVCELPLQLDTADPVALEGALRVYAGKPLINSVCGKQSVMDAVFPLAARYGGALVALTLDESGVPNTVAGRMQIARRIIAEAAKYGIDKRELLFDALCMTVATDGQAARVTLDTVRALKAELGVKTVLGVSNVSFGLPNRPLLTASFIAMAIAAGLDAAILNPNDALARGAFQAACALVGKDDGCARYIAGNTGERVYGEGGGASAIAGGVAVAGGATMMGGAAMACGVAVAGGAAMADGAQAYGGHARAGQGARAQATVAQGVSAQASDEQPAQSPTLAAQGARGTQGGTAQAATAQIVSAQPAAPSPLRLAIERGLTADAAAHARALLDGGVAPLALVDSDVMPALTRVGERYERGTLFLPQLLQSAGAAQAAFELIRERLPAASADPARRVALATVRGDVHDIGKNIVKVLLQNYGFTVIDLGKDVPPERVLEAAREQGAKLVGLSALMTTTVPAMRETIELLHEKAPDVRVIVGGAVLTQAYADTIGADGYAPDAMGAVRLAQRLCGTGEK